MSGFALGSQSTNPLLLAPLFLVASVAWSAVAAIGFAAAVASIAIAASKAEVVEDIVFGKKVFLSD